MSDVRFEIRVPIVVSRSGGEGPIIVGNGEAAVDDLRRALIPLETKIEDALKNDSANPIWWFQFQQVVEHAAGYLGEDSPKVTCNVDLKDVKVSRLTSTERKHPAA